VERYSPPFHDEHLVGTSRKTKRSDIYLRIPARFFRLNRTTEQRPDNVPGTYRSIDLFVASSERNARRVLEALDEFGFGGLGLELGDFTEPDRVVQLGVPPNRVDFVTSIEAVDFEDAWRNCVEGKYGDVSVWFIGRDELLKNRWDEIRMQWTSLGSRGRVRLPTTDGGAPASSASRSDVVATSLRGNSDRPPKRK
jgi:hypothetical protein